jgi:hypothetical protein
MIEKEELERQAIQCRRLAGSVTDQVTIERLSKMADDLEARIRDMDTGEDRQLSAGGSP